MAARQWKPIEKDMAARARAAMDVRVRHEFTWQHAREWLSGLPGGGLNIGYEAVDRHAAGDLRDKVALRFIDRRGGRTDLTYGGGGVGSFHGVIYPPQVALVGFGRITRRPWASRNLIGVRPLVTASLAGDHRATDGATGPVPGYGRAAAATPGGAMKAMNRDEPDRVPGTASTRKTMRLSTMAGVVAFGTAPETG